MQDCRVVELRHRGEPAEFSGELHEGEIPPAKGAGAGCIAVKENPFIFRVDYSVTLLHGDPGTRRQRYKQTRVFNSEQMEDTQEHRSGHLYTSVDINNNPHETWGRTDYI